MQGEDFDTVGFRKLGRRHVFQKGDLVITNGNRDDKDLYFFEEGPTPCSQTA